MTVWGATNLDDSVYVLHYDEEESNGYLFVKALGSGADGSVALIRTIDTGKLAVRKFPLLGDPKHPEIRREPFLPTDEVLFQKFLTDSTFIPAYISVEGSTQFPRSMTMEYCDDTVWDYWQTFLQTESRDKREAFTWMVLGQMLRILTFLHSGHTYQAPHPERWINGNARGRWIPPTIDNQPWRSIIHGDTHLNNIFLSFSPDRGSSAKAPAIVLGDWGRAEYKINMSTYTVNMEAYELKSFLDGLLSLQPRVTLAIERVILAIKKRMAAGLSVLDLVHGGMYDECCCNFERLNVTFALPKVTSKPPNARVFDLSKGAGYISNLWAFKEALGMCAGSAKILRIPREDVSEGGQVDLARAEHVFRGRSTMARLPGNAEKQADT